MLLLLLVEALDVEPPAVLTAEADRAAVVCDWAAVAAWVVATGRGVATVWLAAAVAAGAAVATLFTADVEAAKGVEAGAAAALA